MDSTARKIDNWLKWPFMNSDVQRMTRAVYTGSLDEGTRTGSRPSFYNEAERITDILWEHLLEGRKHLMPDITAKEIYTVCRTFLNTLNRSDVRKPIKLTTKENGNIQAGNAWRVLLYSFYEPETLIPMSGIFEGYEGKKAGLLTENDSVKLDSFLPGGIANYQVSLVSSENYDFAEDFYGKDLLLEMDPKDAKKLFGKKDAEGKSVDKLGKDNGTGWFNYKINRIADPSKKSETHRHEHRAGSQ